jgi:hypothetical protein
MAAASPSPTAKAAALRSQSFFLFDPDQTVAQLCGLPWNVQAPRLRFQENTMKTAMVLLLALATTAVQADNVTTNVNLGGSGADQSAAFGVTHLEKGPFADTFNFSPSAGTYSVNAGLATIGFSPETDVTFTAAYINGQALTLSGPGLFEYAYLLPTVITGPLSVSAWPLM